MPNQSNTNKRGIAALVISLFVLGCSSHETEPIVTNTEDISTEVISAEVLYHFWYSPVMACRLRNPRPRRNGCNIIRMNYVRIDGEGEFVQYTLATTTSPSEDSLGGTLWNDIEYLGSAVFPGNTKHEAFVQ